MKTYRVTLTAAGVMLAAFNIWAPSLKAARQQAQTEKRLYCMYDKPADIPDSRIRTTTRRSPENDD